MTNNKYRYLLEQGKLSSIETGTENVVWTGKLIEIDIVSFEQIPGLDDCIVILDPIKAGSFGVNNVFRITPFGQIVWDVNLPEKFNAIHGISRDHDVYTGIYKITSSYCSLNSYSGFLDDIDYDSGKIINSVFVK